MQGFKVDQALREVFILFVVSYFCFFNLMFGLSWIRIDFGVHDLFPQLIFVVRAKQTQHSNVD